MSDRANVEPLQLQKPSGYPHDLFYLAAWLSVAIPICGATTEIALWGPLAWLILAIPFFWGTKLFSKARQNYWLWLGLILPPVLSYAPACAALMGRPANGECNFLFVAFLLCVLSCSAGLVSFFGIRNTRDALMIVPAAVFGVIVSGVLGWLVFIFLAMSLGPSPWRGG